MLENLVIVIHILACIALILAIILQSGKGGGVSAAFGGGAGAALGQRGAATALGRFTAICAGLFMITSMVLAVYSSPDASEEEKAAAEENKAIDAKKAEEDKKAEEAKHQQQQPAQGGARRISKALPAQGGRS